MNLLLILIIGIVGFVLFSLVKWFIKQFVIGRYPKNVFTEPAYTNPNVEGVEMKNMYTAKKVEGQNFDAIIVGSGMSGLASGCILSKAGKKVLVLERHKKPGGFMHGFGYSSKKKEGNKFLFEYGIHYIGQMNEGNPTKLLLDNLCDKTIKMDSYDNNYDRVVLFEKDKKELEIEISKGRNNYINLLKEKFPEEKENIDKYFERVDQVANGGVTVSKFFISILPLWLAKLLHYTLGYFLFKNVRKTTSEVINEVTKNKRLQLLLSYFFGDYTENPDDSSFYTHAMIHQHYIEDGGFFPTKGAKDIIKNMISVISKSGGLVLGKAEVQTLLIKDGKVVGVKLLEDGNCIYAPIVISTVGINNTYNKLLSEKVRQQYGFNHLKIVPSVQHQGVFIGYDESIEELGLKYQNTWITNGSNYSENLEKYLNCNGNLDIAKGIDIPFIFMNIRPNKGGEGTTINLLFPSNLEWFKDWEGSRAKKRGTDYKDLKQQFIDRAMEIVYNTYPQLRKFEAVIDGSTPLTVQYFCNAPSGESYGQKSSIDRYDNPNFNRIVTPIEGLYLSGQDVLMVGIVGALMAAVLTTSTILHRNLMGDLDALTNVNNNKSKGD
ncbi:hypothetical protein ABK040_008766 [Willaertia magna]